MEKLNEKEEKFIKHFYKDLKKAVERTEKDPYKIPYSYSLTEWFKRKYLFQFGSLKFLKELLNSLKQKDFIKAYHPNLGDEIMIAFNQNKIIDYIEQKEKT